ncbi:hypothetical protein BGW80DRAFT_799923 [Lactifluus volemus]|nr:hypothetical protein BGW80DRAFT_799923 [Lactifluus volemus]
MVGAASRPPFVLLFLAGILSTVAFAALTFIFVFSWHYFRGGHKVEPSDNEFPLPALEEGNTVPDALDFSCRGPSRLGGISPLSAERAGETPRPQSQFQAQPRTEKGSQDDMQHPHPDALQTFDYIVSPVTLEQSEPAGDHTERAEGISNITTLGNNGDVIVHPERSRPLVFPTPPTMPPLSPIPRSRFSMSTVWSQESMWPRDKVPDIPVPSLAHIPVQRSFRFSNIMTPGSPIRHSTLSFPRSVGKSDFEE